MTLIARIGSLATLLLLVALPAPPLQAAQIDVLHTTIEKLLRDPARNDGRKYLAGQAGTNHWVYVRAARVTQDRGRLRLTARLRAAFSGLAMADEVEVVILARPQVVGGILSLAQPEITIGGQSAAALTALVVTPLLQLARIDLRAKLAALIQENGSAEGVAFRLLRFEIQEPMQVRADRTCLNVDFTLEVQ